MKLKEKTTAKGGVKVFKNFHSENAKLLKAFCKSKRKGGTFYSTWCEKLLSNLLGKPHLDTHNLIVNQGLYVYPILLQNQTVPTISVAIGTDNTTESVGQTALGNQVAADTSPSASASSATCVIYAIIGPGWSGTFYEFGLFIGGYMHSRIVDAIGQSKAADEPIVIQWTLSYARG